MYQCVITQSPIQILIYYDFIFAMCQNSRFDHVKVNKVGVIATLLKVVTVNEANFNGLIKSRIVVIIDSIVGR